MPVALTVDGQIYFVDLPALIVGGFRPAEGPGAGWVAVDYELDTFAGVGLATGADSPASELILDLGLTGRHRLHFAHNPAVRAWLDGDPGYCQIPGNSHDIREYAFPAADLTGRRLHLAPVRGTDHTDNLTLFYIRAEPCHDAPPHRRNLVATNDGHGVFCAGLDSPRDLYRHLFPFADSDFFRIAWGLYGGGPLTMRPGSRFDDLEARLNPAGFFHERDRIYAESLQRMRTAGADPLAVVRAATREYGLELHYYMRMAAFYGPFPKVSWTTRFFTQHPEWRCRDEFGQTVNMISYAWPQVQDYVLGFFSELLDYDPDGLCLAFNRGLPPMICEEPVLEAYRRRHGRTPRLPEEVDTPELLTVRHDLLAGFVERVQRLVASRGKTLSCIAPRDFERSRRLGLDLEVLLKRGLVQSAMIGAGHGDDPELNAELAPLCRLRALGTPLYAGGSAVRAHGCAWVPNDLPARARQMAAILDAGLDGGFFWDAEHMIGTDWEAMRRFGDRTILDRIARGEWPASTSRKTRRLSDLVVGRYNPWHAY